MADTTLHLSHGPTGKIPIKVVDLGDGTFGLAVALQAEGEAETVILGAGSAIIGKVGIDQTTPGTTNAVQIVGGKAAAIQTLLSSQMNGLANAGVSALGAEFDNSAALYRYADFEAFVDFAVNPTAGNLLELYLCASLDGTNYADGGDATLINTSHYVGGFVLRAVTDPPQRITLRNVAIPAAKFKVHVKNSSGQAMTAVDTNTVKMVAYR